MARSLSQAIAQLHSRYAIDLAEAAWSMAEVARLQKTIALLAKAMGGAGRFADHLGGVKIEKKEIGAHGGEAYAHHVRLPLKGNFSAWTVVHELAHAWDANRGWQLSVALEKATGGYTNPLLGWVRRLGRKTDVGRRGVEPGPGQQGRWPGCNAAGYFYGGQPSGSNWNFNRKEDFAESVAMYIGWGKKNDLSAWAQARIDRYRLKNGAKHKSFGVENWADYAKYFYPPGGDYAKTTRWSFVDELMRAP